MTDHNAEKAREHDPLCPEAPSPGGRAAGYIPVPIGADDCLCDRAAAGPPPCRFTALREHKPSECPECNPNGWRMDSPPTCDDCGHQHTNDGCTGAPTPSDLWAGVSPSSCDCAWDQGNPPGTPTPGGTS